jgi:hypothetical protein
MATRLPLTGQKTIGIHCRSFWRAKLGCVKTTPRDVSRDTGHICDMFGAHPGEIRNVTTDYR